jgi:hypothetical protein
MSEQCKYDLVPVGGMSVRFRRCENNAKLDGFCMTHHPDKVKLRHQKSAQLWKERHDNTRTVRLSTLRKAEGRIAELESERKNDCINFFRWFWNQPGTNADQGYDEWLKALEAGE